MNAKFLGVIQGFAIWVIFLSFSCAAPEGPVISDVSDNHSTYPNSQIPEFEKLEATLSISRYVAQNMQWPYDPIPAWNKTWHWHQCERDLYLTLGTGLYATRLLLSGL